MLTMLTLCDCFMNCFETLECKEQAGFLEVDLYIHLAEKYHVVMTKQVKVEDFHFQHCTLCATLFLFVSLVSVMLHVPIH